MKRVFYNKNMFTAEVEMIVEHIFISSSRVFICSCCNFWMVLASSTDMHCLIIWAFLPLPNGLPPTLCLQDWIQTLSHVSKSNLLLPNLIFNIYSSYSWIGDKNWKLIAVKIGPFSYKIRDKCHLHQFGMILKHIIICSK